MSSDKNEMLEAAQRVWSMLDHLYENNPAEYKKFVDQQMKEGKEALTPPEPVFCLMCQVTGSQAKQWQLFINVCKWIRVPRPRTDNDPIPVKGGVLRYVIDSDTRKKTKDHLLFDVAFNPYVLEECLKDRIMEGMLISLCLDFVEDITELKILDRKTCTKIKDLCKGPQSDILHSLDEQWSDLLSPESKLDIGDSILKQLSKMRQHDEKIDSTLPTLKLFRDQGKKKLVEELNSKPVASSKNESNGLKMCATPEHSIFIREADDKHPERRVCVKITLPGVKSVGEVELEVSKEDIQLKVDTRYSLMVNLPVHISEDQTKATFSPKTSILSVTMSCL